MNDELQKKLLIYLDVLEAGAKKAGEFAQTEIPEAVREWLTWLAIERFSYAAVFLLLSVMMFVVGLRSGRQCYDLYLRCWNKEDKEAYAWSSDTIYGWSVASRVLQAASLVPLIFGTGYYLMQGTKVVVAPRVVIIEEVGKLVGVAKK